jgi:serine/threonine protein kinase
MLDLGITGFQGSARWMAPELHADEDESFVGRHSKASDVYALAITCWEVAYLFYMHSAPFSCFCTGLYWPTAVSG